MCCKLRPGNDSCRQSFERALQYLRQMEGQHARMARLALSYHGVLECLREAELCNLLLYLRSDADEPVLILPQQGP